MSLPFHTLRRTITERPEYTTTFRKGSKINNQLFSDLIVVRKDNEVGSDVYVSCTELCDHLSMEAQRLVEEGLNIINRANEKFINDEDQVAYISTGATFEYVVDMGKLIADSALSTVGSAMVSTISTIEDMGFTDE